MQLSIIIINYQSREFLKKCLISIERHLKTSADFNFEVILVNNDQEQIGSLDNLFRFPIKIIEVNKNIGFGKANNLASREALGEFLFFLNPDTEIIDSSLMDMVAFMKKSPKIGIIGPKIIEANRNLPQPWTCGKKTTLLSILFRNTINKPWNKNKITEVDWISGTALMINKEIFDEINGFDEKFFMYFEDQDLCLRIKKTGKTIVFHPISKIIHHNGKSWNDKKDKKSFFYQSQDYFFQKHHKKTQANLLKFIRRIFKNQ